MASHTNNPIPISRKDLATFFQLGMEHRLIDELAVQRWVDAIIVADDEPPIWAIDFAFEGKNWHRRNEILKSVSGEASSLLASQMLVALIRRKRMAHELSGRQVTRLVLKLLPDGWNTAGHLSGILQFDHIYFDCLDLGNSTLTEDQADKMLDEFLEHYARYENLIPKEAQADHP